MVEDGVIGCLARLLGNTDEGLLQSSCIALALTAFHHEVKNEMVRVCGSMCVSGWVSVCVFVCGTGGGRCTSC